MEGRGFIAGASGDRGAISAGDVPGPASDGGKDPAGSVRVAAADRRAARARGVGETSRNGGMGCVACLVGHASSNGAPVAGDSVRPSLHAASTDGSAVDAGGDAVGKASADDIRRGVGRLQTQRPGTVHPKLQGLVISGSHEVRAGRRAGIAEKRPIQGVGVGRVEREYVAAQNQPCARRVAGAVVHPVGETGRNAGEFTP
jgi:hypothetical protein